MTTYEIIKAYRELEELKIEVDENGEFLYSDEYIKEIESYIKATKEEKLNAIQDFKKVCKAEAERFKEKSDKQLANKEREEKKIEFLIGLQEMLLDGEKLKTDEYTFSYRKSKSVRVFNEDLISDIYFTTTTTIDKALIKKALADGKPFKGAELVEKISLSVR